MAEVIRRGFQDAHETQWPEEDQGFGRWPPGCRFRLFGSERPFDDPFRSKPYLAHQFGLLTGGKVRWYVEGETECYAVLHILEEPSRRGVELVNLKGEIGKEKGNAARKLEDALREDLALKRFSMISFDRDSKANERAVRRQVQQDHVVGFIDANDPDFEFGNFSLGELVEIAASMDERLGFEAGAVRRAGWKGVDKGKGFAKCYEKASARRRSPKGKEWGEALASYAQEHPTDPRTGKERPLLVAMRAAFWAWNSDYGLQKKHSTFDPRTFEPEDR